MKVLIIEDDQGKERQLAEVVSDFMADATIVAQRSYQSGLKEAVVSRPEIILLDMSLPNFDVRPSAGEMGGQYLPYGGRDLLREVRRRKVPSRVVVVTQYDVFRDGEDMMTLDELRVSLSEQFPNNYIATVYYQAAQSTWRAELVGALMKARQVIGGFDG